MSRRVWAAAAAAAAAAAIAASAVRGGGPLIGRNAVGELAAEVGAAAARWDREGGFVIGELREVWAGR